MQIKTVHDYQARPDLLKDKVILITGAGDGIGRQAALSFAEHGATVILLGRTVAKLEAVYDEIEQAGGATPAIIPLDLKGASKQNYQDMAATIKEQFGRLDGLLHNAGILSILSPFTHIEEDDFRDSLQVNVTGPMLMTQALLPVMQLAPQASLVFTSSGVGRNGRAYWGSYSVSKFATEGMAQVIADEYDTTTVRTNVINPGATRTSMRSKAYPAEDPKQLKTPLDLMPTYLYLMGDDSTKDNNICFDAQ
ncbi:YciK family oxidoreductase [Idiomarina sp. OT37-5b]|jgi:NAD(P)-dependent dehydrogenase (short-subunit alcohol dehydrogenase family)|uniref:YciK family oxidoreductase n=1 Tax=Idiomarina aquatica TaxID=1327752 RepID=A0AA94JDR4_9GAMM|nr:MULTISPECIES: YciK family oxidoreductase [Idiomarina]AVJ55465.1 YciK family oxidoreductase [Idiomarina sp. OT37-5b]RUO44913.1 YciK family oxidoreductase [Idiomarina aquatica]